jgi:hypothetical protein
MNRRKLILLVTGVILAHGVFFFLIAGTHPLPKMSGVPRPNFVAKEATWLDKESGEQITYHEYRVSTKLALPDALMEKK